MFQEGICEYSVLVFQSAVPSHGWVSNGSESASELVLWPESPYARGVGTGSFEHRARRRGRGFEHDGARRGQR